MTRSVHTMTLPAKVARLAGLARNGVTDLLAVGPVYGDQPPSAHADPRGIAGYYCDFRHKAAAADATSAAFGGAQGPQPFSPWVIPVAQTALGYWELILDGEPVQERFLALADWLVETAHVDATGASWPVLFAMGKYGVRPGWRSAMGQSEAISVLLRAHRLTGEDRYAELALQAVGPMTLEVSRGGVQRRVDGHLVLEEYPTRQPCAVLNGWIFALFGLHELVVATGDPRAAAVLADSRAGLLALLPRYDVGWWSRYSLYPHERPDLSRPFYQRLHVVLLEALHRIEPDARLTLMAQRWKAQYTPAALIRISADKLAFRRVRRPHPHDEDPLAAPGPPVPGSASWGPG